MEYSLGGGHKKHPPTRAHRAVLQIRCPILLQEGKFITKIDKSKDKWRTHILETALPTCSPTVLAQLMIYVYSGAMEVQRFSLPTLLDMCAVGATLGLEEIVWTCEHKVRELLNIERVHSILKGAEDRKLEGVKNFALQYAFEHWSDFIGNQEGAKILGLELFQDVSAKYAKGDKVTYPEGTQPENSILKDYRRLYEEMPSPDMQLEVGTEKLPCHRAVLGMYSDALAGRLTRHLKSGVPGSMKLVDQDPSAGTEEVKSSTALASFLRFVYYGEVKMDPIDACEMIHKVNGVYKLNTFQLLCEYTIINNISAKSVVPILGVTYIKGFENKAHIQALRKQCLAYIISQFATVDLNALNGMPPEIRTDLLQTLQTAFKNGKLGAPYEGGSQSVGEDEPAVQLEDSNE